MLNDEYQELRQTVEAFARDVVAPVIGDFYEREEFPYDVVRQMGAMGLSACRSPEEYGGMGGDYFALCLPLEELARVDSSVAITLEAAVFARRDAIPVRHRRTARGVAAQAGHRRDAGRAFGLTEPGGGSDVPGGMRTTARARRPRMGDQTGRRRSSRTRGTDTSRRRRRGRADRRAGDLHDLVPSGTPGSRCRSSTPKVGWNASDTRELSFTDCRVPRRQPCWAERAAATRSSCRPSTRPRPRSRAIGVGLAQGCVDECLR
ncbi:hypothetical protein GCM10020220_018220 [Nonomuraea rubra]